MPSRWNIEHVTIIDAPIDKVWETLYDDIHHWKNWNLWTLLEQETPSPVGGGNGASSSGMAKVVPAPPPPPPREGMKGKLHACYKGDNQKWETFDFVFGPISTTDHLITWVGNVGPGGCLFHGYHTMQLTSTIDNDGTKTRLVHKEIFSGLLPTLGVGLPYKQLEENYLKMNLALKEHIERGEGAER